MIELGGGENPQFRPNLDYREGPSVDYVADLSGPLPLPDNEFDGVFCAYALEHVSWRNVKAFLGEVLRILKEDRTAVFIIPNLLEQARVLVGKTAWEDQDICMIFGDQDYMPGNSHLCGFSPESAMRIFREVGFADVLVMPHPNCRTDMIVEAKKSTPVRPELWSPDERRAAFDRRYFEGGGGGVGGYAREGYWDYPVHWTTLQRVMERSPESVLEIGCARGYVLKRLQDIGIRVGGLEISKHCFLTRAVDQIKVWDITEAPWPIGDKEFDLLLSCAVLEHIPEDSLRTVVGEMERVSKRGLHGVDFGEQDDGFDKTHCTLKPDGWWRETLPESHEVVTKGVLEDGPVILPPPDGTVKLNLGSFSVMFHHGWVNLDIVDLGAFARSYGYIFRQHDVRTGLPFDEGVVDLIFSSHMIEHLTFEEGRALVAECFRVLKPGGVARFSCPDGGKLMKMYSEQALGEFDELNEQCAAASSQIEKFWALVSPNHLAVYDWDKMQAIFSGAGFRVSRRGFRDSGNTKMVAETMDMFPDLSLFVEGVKL
jgi:predicted SAM-dependent methyltransferase